MKMFGVGMLARHAASFACRFSLSALVALRVAVVNLSMAVADFSVSLAVPCAPAESPDFIIWAAARMSACSFCSSSLASIPTVPSAMSLLPFLLRLQPLVLLPGVPRRPSLPHQPEPHLLVVPGPVVVYPPLGPRHPLPDEVPRHPRERRHQQAPLLDQPPVAVDGVGGESKGPAAASDVSSPAASCPVMVEV